MDANEAHESALKRIGISLASFFHPFWYIPGLGDWWPRMWVRWVVKTALGQIGYRFLQALPCRGMSGLFQPVPCEKVKYIEPAWRGIKGEGHGSFWAATKARLRRDPVGPWLEDWMFFPCPSACEKGWKELGGLKYRTWHLPAHWEDLPVIPVVHEPGPGLLEISPGLWMTPEEILALEGPLDGLVLDTWHLRRVLRDDELAKAGCYPNCQKHGELVARSGGSLGWWKESLPILLPQTRVIHVQPRRDDGGEELRKFIRSEPTELGQMIARARLHGYNGDWVVEASAASLGVIRCTPGKIRETMIGMYGALLDHLTAPIGQFED